MTYEERLADAEAHKDFCWDYFQEMLRLWEYAGRMKDEAVAAWDAAQSDVIAARNAPHEATDD